MRGSRMNRRNFLQLAALVIAGKSAERVFPFRVYSIPKEIVVVSHPLDTMFLNFNPALAQRRFMESFDGQRFKLYNGGRGGYPKAILPPVDWYSKVETMGNAITEKLLKEKPLCNFSP